MFNTQMIIHLGLYVVIQRINYNTITQTSFKITSNTHKKYIINEEFRSLIGPRAAAI